MTLRLLISGKASLTILMCTLFFNFLLCGTLKKDLFCFRSPEKKNCQATFLLANVLFTMDLGQVQLCTGKGPEGTEMALLGGSLIFAEWLGNEELTGKNCLCVNQVF